MSDHVPIKERETCTVETGCAISGLGRSTLWKAMQEGKLQYINYGRRRLIKIKSLLKMLRQHDA